MHVLFREQHGLDAADQPVDLQQSPADLVVLSFSDSDLNAFAAGWTQGRAELPSLRLANLVTLKHPLSVDTYIEATLKHARGVLVRLIGGEPYWSYGLAELNALARRNGMALAVLPADGRRDERLEALSTLPQETLQRLNALCDAGGAEAAQAALKALAFAAGLLRGAPDAPAETPPVGFYDPDRGVIAQPPALSRGVIVTFYRSYFTSADLGPIDALILALRARGFEAFGLFAPTLKGEAACLVELALMRLKPAAIVNATAFSARDSNGHSPLDVPGCPVFQVALSTATREAWAGAERGLSPADLAMHVVLPEVDGRIFLGVISFKGASAKHPDLQCALMRHQPDPPRIEAVVGKIARHMALAHRPAAQKRLAILLSTYPGKTYQLAHAVGLDALASLEAILADLRMAGHAVEVTPPEGGFGSALAEHTLAWPLAEYRAALSRLPESLRQALHDTWGAPEADPACHNEAFHFAALESGNVLVALQPERGTPEVREADYHDTARIPRHAYVAFYLWLSARKIDALIHIGAHGTLEWLPGKAVALSGDCWPEALISGLPVLYPFIVNDPGEAAQAKRRISALTLGHLPPPLADADTPEALIQLEHLLDEYSTADGLDPARRDRLISAIREEARARGVEADLGLEEGASAAEALVRIDRFVCDIKESRFGQGLHIFGRGPCGDAERAGLLAALNGERVAPGPSGSPNRGRADVLPTGRNLFSVDPRGVPTRAAHAQGVKLAEELIRRHLQEEGDYPKSVVVDLWGSATMRTAGEDFAMALHLAGLAPRWDVGSERVCGFEILPLALLDRPRIDVTLRVSGLFRDVFPGLAQMFELASAALARRGDEAELNPYTNLGPRVFAPKPGTYGVGMGALAETFSEDARHAAGEAWLAGSSFAIDTRGESYPAREALEARVLAAEAFVHTQDLPETDLLLAADYAAHEAGFAAAVARLGGDAPTLYHLDSTNPAAPRARLLNEEIARVVRARAANPRWISGMMRHGFRGGAEIAATLEHLAAFAQLTRDVPNHLFDLYFEATLEDARVREFLARENPAALKAMHHTFAALDAANLWVTRRNSIRAALEASP